MAGDGNTQGRAIFISYRRDDSEGEAGRLFDDLVRAYGDASVFMDVAGIQPGLDFRKAIDDNVATCGVLLAVVGPTWVSVTDSSGNRRLENPDDYVRLEIASALARQIPVIPVLVHDARMPPLDQLPDNLKDLRYRNSVELTHARWNSDVALLIGALKSYVSADQSHQTETVHATIPVQLPAPQPSGPAAAPKSKLALFAGIGVAAAVVLAGVIFAVVHSRAAQQPVISPQPVVQQPAQPSAQASSQPSSQPSTQPSSGAQPAAGQPADAQPQAAVSADETALLGNWKNSVDPEGDDGLVRISVADVGGQLMVQAWGNCSDHPCDWGSRKASLQGGVAETKSFDLRKTPQEINDERSAKIVLTPTADGLQVTVKNTLHTPSGATKSKLNLHQFIKAS